MEAGRASVTARAAAAHRAAHQVIEGGVIFRDPLAVRILGVDEGDLVEEARKHPSGRRMRLFIAVRTRFAEDALAGAMEEGVRQVVILGAGLDTYAYRSRWPEGARIFEVDHPATQAWKRERLAEAGIEVPGALTFAPVDFERESLGEGLTAAGFDGGRRTFFTWLGVVPYLTREAIWGTLGFMAGLRGGAEVVFDYGNPPETLGAEMRGWVETLAARVAERGEAWVSYFETGELHERLRKLGFGEIEDLGPGEIGARYFGRAAGAGSEAGGHVVGARTAAGVH